MLPPALCDTPYPVCQGFSVMVTTQTNAPGLNHGNEYYPVCVPGMCIRKHRRVWPSFHLWLPRRCRMVERSECPQILRLPASRASLHTEGRRRFKRSKDRCCELHSPAPVCRWRYRRTVIFHRDAKPAIARRRRASCPHKD